jgi:hypothetical protein
MAFLIPVIEGAIELGEVVARAITAGEAGSLAAAGGIAAEGGIAGEASSAGVQPVALDFDGAMATEDLAQYEADYYRMPSDLTNNGYQLVVDEDALMAQADEGGVGYAMDGGSAPPMGDVAQYMPLAQEVDKGIMLRLYQDPPFPRELVTIGMAKVALVGGFWHFLDPLTGAPIYAVAGDDPRVDSIMQALGYTQSAREAGQVLREYFRHIFGYDMPQTPAGTATQRASVGAPRRQPRIQTRSQYITHNNGQTKTPIQEEDRYLLMARHHVTPLVLGAIDGHVPFKNVMSVTFNRKRYHNIEFSISNSTNEKGTHQS